MSAIAQPTSPLDRPLTITFFKNAFAFEKHEERKSLRALVPQIMRTTRDDKKKLPWLKLAKFGNLKTDLVVQDDGTTKGGSLRHGDNMLGISGIEADYDHEITTVDEAIGLLRAANIAALIYTSPSHTDDTPRWRVLCPLSRDYGISERNQFLARLNGLFHGSLARESFALPQSYYFGAVNRSPSHRAELVDGDFIDLRTDLDKSAIGRPSEEKERRPPPATEPAPNASPYLEAVIRNALAKVSGAGEGEKHHTLRDQAKLLGGFAHVGHYTRADMVARLIDALPDTAKDLKAAKATAEWGFDAGAAEPLTVPPPRINVLPFPSGRETPEQEPTEDKKTGPETPKSPYRFPVVLFDDIPISLDANDFVQGVLVEQGSAVVYGESNAGKTFWMTDLALHVASGFPWNGRRVEKGGVVYCVLEGGRGFSNRVAAWRDAKCVSGIPFVSIPAALNLLDPAADVLPLIEDIKTASERLGYPVKLVVIDTLSRALAGGNENDSADMGAMVRNMDLIRRETGACVLFIHHSGKDAARGARGHSLLRAALDTEIEVVAAPESEEKTATVVKQRELSKGDVFGFKLDVVTLGQNRHGEDVTTCLVVPIESVSGVSGRIRKLSANEKLGLRALDLAIGSTGAYLPNTPDYPPNTFATTQDAWRREFYQLHGDDKNAARLAFNRGRTSLLADKTITQRGDYVWKVSQK